MTAPLIFAAGEGVLVVVLVLLVAVQRSLLRQWRRAYYALRDEVESVNGLSLEERRQ